MSGGRPDERRPGPATDSMNGGWPLHRKLCCAGSICFGVGTILLMLVITMTEPCYCDWYTCDHDICLTIGSSRRAVALAETTEYST